MRRSRTIEGQARSHWITRAEAAFTLGVSFQEIDRRIAEGSLPHRSVGAVLLVDVGPGPSETREPAGSPADTAVEADPEVDRPRPRPLRPERPKREHPVVRHPRLERADLERPTIDPPRREPPVPSAVVPATAPAPPPPAPALDPPIRAERRRRRSRDRMPIPRAAIVAGIAIVLAAGLGVLQFVLYPATGRRAPVALAAPPSAAPSASASPIPVGRDPFSSPFGTSGKGDHAGGVVVRPPGVVREGDRVTAAATVVNEDHRRWLPRSEVTFVARDSTGRVIAKTTTSVSLAPGGSQTVIAPDLGVDPSEIAAIEAHIRPAKLRTGRFPAPDVWVTISRVESEGNAVSGVLSIDRGSSGSATLACVLFDPLDQLAGVNTTTVDPSKARAGHLRFWMSIQPAIPGPYRASCSVG